MIGPVAKEVSPASGDGNSEALGDVPTHMHAAISVTASRAARRIARDRSCDMAALLMYCHQRRKQGNRMRQGDTRCDCLSLRRQYLPWRALTPCEESEQSRGFCDLREAFNNAIRSEARVQANRPVLHASTRFVLSD